MVEMMVIYLFNKYFRSFCYVFGSLLGFEDVMVVGGVVVLCLLGKIDV